MSERLDGMRPGQVAGRVAGAGFLGMLIFLSLNTACNIMVMSCGEENVLKWAALKVHERVVTFGDDLGIKHYGAVNWGQVNWHTRTLYHVGPLMVFGFGFGLLLGLLSAGVRWWVRRGEVVVVGGGPAGDLGGGPPGGAAPGIVIPAHWPLLIALTGVFFHGHILGLAAILLAGRIRAGRWLVWTTRAAGAGVALLWSVGIEQYWKNGWHDQYRAIGDFLLTLEHRVDTHRVLCGFLLVALVVGATVVVAAVMRRARARG